MNLSVEERERFYNMTRMNTDKKCWNWKGKLNEHGYGRLKIRGKMMKAHRISYIIWFGNIPKGLVIDHVCRNRKCVNPFHLDAVTNAENQRRRRKELL